MTATVLPFEALEREAPEPVKIKEEQVRITKPTLLLNLKLAKPGKTRKGDMSQVDTDADKSALRLSKELLASPGPAVVSFSLTR